MSEDPRHQTREFGKVLLLRTLNAVLCTCDFFFFFFLGVYCFFSSIVIATFPIRMFVNSLFFCVFFLWKWMFSFNKQYSRQCYVSNFSHFSDMNYDMVFHHKSSSTVIVWRTNGKTNCNLFKCWISGKKIDQTLFICLYKCECICVQPAMICVRVYG